MKDGVKRINRLVLFLVFSFLILFSSCGKKQDVREIRQLEKSFRQEKDASKKSNLANLLNKKYSLYHLRNPSDTSFLSNWADMALAGKEYENAKWVLEEYIALNKTNPDIFEKCGKANAILGFFPEAAECFQKASSLESAKEKKLFLTGLAKTYHKADSLIKVIEEEIKENKDIGRNILRRADVLIDVQHFTAAKYDIENYLKDYKSAEYAYYLLARLWWEADDPELARQQILKYFSQAEPSDSSYHKATELRNRITDKIQITEIEKELEGTENKYSAWVELGSRYFRQENYDQAEKYFNALIQNYPDSLLGYLYRGQVMIKRGNLEEALKDIQQVIVLKPGNISAHNLKAYIHLLKNEDEELIKEINYIESANGELLDILKQKNRE